MSEKKLCIVGNGVTRDLAPYFDHEALIWTTASVAQNIPRVDCVFEIHDGVYDAAFLTKFDCTVMMKSKDPKIKKSEKFPLDKLIYHFGSVFNGTISMILAYAWIAGYRDVWLYGVDFSTEEEINRRMMFMYVKGMFEGKGGAVHISPGSHLTDKCLIYQYDKSDSVYLTDMQKKLSGQLAADEEMQKQITARTYYARGALDTIATMEKRMLW